MYDLHDLRDERRLLVSVCAVDGVEVSLARSGRLVHLDDIPRGVDPSHDIIEVDPWQYRQKADEETDVHALAQELLDHHVAWHPASDCPFAARLTEALRSRR